MIRGAYLTLQISECRDRAIYCQNKPQYKAEAELYTMAALGYQVTLQNSSLDELMEDVEVDNENVQN